GRTLRRPGAQPERDASAVILELGAHRLELLEHCAAWWCRTDLLLRALTGNPASSLARSATRLWAVLAGPRSDRYHVSMALETRSVVDALRTEMQRQILRGSIPPGMGLAEVSVAQTFDVARPTAKAAIEQLVNVGLLRRCRNKTARVPLLDIADGTRLYLSPRGGERR